MEKWRCGVGLKQRKLSFRVSSSGSPSTDTVFTEVYVLVLLFASTEGRVQQNSSNLQFVLHNLVQFLKGPVENC